MHSPGVPTSPPEEDRGEARLYGNVFAELESVDLPLGNTLSPALCCPPPVALRHCVSSALTHTNTVTLSANMADSESLETITEHERILQEIESTDTACLGPTLRSVYDDQPNAHKRFMEKLDARIRNHDREIEKMCNFHHQGFVDAITELLKVRADAEKLMGQVSDTNRRLQDAGREVRHSLALFACLPLDGKNVNYQTMVTAQTEEVIRCRLQQRNMATTVEKLQLCIPVLEMYSKLKEQLESKRLGHGLIRQGFFGPLVSGKGATLAFHTDARGIRSTEVREHSQGPRTLEYYSALKTMEQLENMYIPRVSQYRFCQIMAEMLPKLREEIKEISMSDLKDFLESIRKHSDKIGETAMRQAQQLRTFNGAVQKQAILSCAKPLHEVGLNGRTPVHHNGLSAEAADEEEVDEEVLTAQDLVDFSPVYRCLHIYTVLVNPPRDSRVIASSNTIAPYKQRDFQSFHSLLINIISALNPSEVSWSLLALGATAHLLRTNPELIRAPTKEGDRETFENYYRKQRKKQARLVLQPQSNMHETVEGYRKYFNQIVGFFVVEDHILHATQGLVTRAFTEELWNMALSKVIAVLRTHSSYCNDPDLVLELKNLIVIFADTLQGYGFPVNRLFDLLFEVRDQYNETLLKKWALVFRDIFEQDNYSPIPVENEEEYKAVVSRFPFHDAEIEKQEFPKKLPMSQSVPQIYSQVKEFIYASLKFSESLHRRPLQGLVQIIINTTHLEQACKYLEDFITNITNVSPETMHTTRLYGLSTFKASEVVRFSKAGIHRKDRSRLELLELYQKHVLILRKDARHAAEGEIYTKLNQKIDEFIQLADYEWGMAESDGRASGYLMDLINFLRSTFQVFTHLPSNVSDHAAMSGKVAQTACMSACKHLATSLMQMLLDTELKQISMGAIQQFNLDVIQCELFASSEPVPGFQGDTLQLAFIDLRQVHSDISGSSSGGPTRAGSKIRGEVSDLASPQQIKFNVSRALRSGREPTDQITVEPGLLLDLFMVWDWSTYLADYGQPSSKYLRVNPSTALALLEKMKDTSKKNNIFSQFRKNDRDKQKLIETVVKQLRSLVNGMSQHS
ncbi:hypothetical protein DNTS_023162 [Danionella cerebrum]|uniref:Uncharacterized protein n=1 Tax=Danionella cerebrum TaxID=2873325 RepID=A0A553MQX1_9TELE|nr:hypothetical protein DNTS_023162 [Danionella translucida]